ncbi:MAG: DUF6903 family protein [Faecalibacterium sp.]
MKAYWKNHPALRMVLMLVLFVLALVLVVSGWKMTGQLAGLGIMLVGVALLLAVLAHLQCDLSGLTPWDKREVKENPYG